MRNKVSKNAMQATILFRSELGTEEERLEATTYFPVAGYRHDIPPNSLIIPRYSALPYYEELESFAAHNNCKLINSYEQHRFVANIMNWYPMLANVTPKTYETWENLPPGQYVVKGKTNSRKFQWNRRMFAPSVSDIPRIAESLLDDPLIAEQGLVVREYIPLETLDFGINGLPITTEYRLFFLGDQLISGGYYWSNFPEFITGIIPHEALQLASSVAKTVCNSINFFVVDVAKTATGEWIVIELNDGSMSGLSCITPTEFYRNLRQSLNERIV